MNINAQMIYDFTHSIGGSIIIFLLIFTSLCIIINFNNIAKYIRVTRYLKILYKYQKLIDVFVLFTHSKKRGENLNKGYFIGGVVFRNRENEIVNKYYMKFDSKSKLIITDISKGIDIIDTDINLKEFDASEEMINSLKKFVYLLDSNFKYKPNDNNGYEFKYRRFDLVGIWIDEDSSLVEKSIAYNRIRNIISELGGETNADITNDL